ncbi:hypothetical protein FA13DRAFT_1717127 [Coprinellus micaceus]|uniref:Uncharacterized protein n=1 Tax=Coprinellus micaceus TaxID=71717 RepID=A0A4Y7SI32_COPMI|nr:hypothetical protein FA13DRAFT_1717127 [Coprinellus micaceus]
MSSYLATPTLRPSTTSVTSSSTPTTTMLVPSAITSDDFLEARAKGAPYNVKQKKKSTPAAQKARKDAVRTKVSGNQAKNAAKKKDPAEQGEDRASIRQASLRWKTEAEQARIPCQGADKRSPKSAAKQAAANKRTKDRKAAGRANFADTKAKYKKTTSLPSRKQTFSANGKKVSGKNVRTAVFNSHHFNGNKGNKPAPKPFNNHEQGAAGKKHRPLPKMKGAGQEYPIQQQERRVPRRGRRRNDACGGTSFKGVVAHDASRDKSHPGYNDHMQVKAKKNKSKTRYS